MNQPAVEALYSATYLEDYLDAMEINDDVQRHLSRMREMDLAYQINLRELEQNMASVLEGDLEPGLKKKIHFKIQQLLMSAQDIGDEKLQIMQQVQDLVDNKARQLELDKKNLDFGRDENDIGPRESRFHGDSIIDRNLKRARRGGRNEFVPSILGPSSLEATSFSESSNHHHHLLNLDDDVSAPPPPKERGRGKGHSSSSGSYLPSSSYSQKGGGGAEATTSHSNTSQRERQRRHSSSEKYGGGSSAAKIIASVATGSAGPMEVAGSQTSFTERSSASTSSDNIQAAIDAASTAASTSSQRSAVSTTPRKQKIQAGEKKVKQKRKSKQANESSPSNIPIDPDEPTYCLCDQVSYGEMIMCDNDLCPIEWFHFSCVSLLTKPKGKWYCNLCRGDRPTIMKPKALFMKELEKYNKEKEEKA